MDKLCPKCNKEFPEDAKFCSICGTPLMDAPKEYDASQALTDANIAYCSISDAKLLCKKTKMTLKNDLKPLFGVIFIYFLHNF